MQAVAVPIMRWRKLLSSRHWWIMKKAIQNAFKEVSDVLAERATFRLAS